MALSSFSVNSLSYKPWCIYKGMNSIKSELQQYMERIDDEDSDLEALVSGWKDFDLALIGNVEGRPKLKIVDFQYQGLNEKQEKLTPLIQSELSDWTYEFDGINRTNDITDYEFINDLDIYLAESVNEERMDEFSEVFYGNADHWRYLG